VLLAALDEAGPASQAELSRRTTIDRSIMVATVNELAGAGLVERTPDPTDRRRNVVTLTAAGRRRLRKLDRLLTGVQDDLLAPLSAEERAQLVHLLTRVVDHHSGG
jgi:DNA-binding MarR family transcriptional regulator